MDSICKVKDLKKGDWIKVTEKHRKWKVISDIMDYTTLEQSNPHLKGKYVLCFPQSRTLVLDPDQEVIINTE